jgi:hypothetical protein
LLQLSFNLNIHDYGKAIKAAFRQDRVISNSHSLSFEPGLFSKLDKITELKVNDCNAYPLLPFTKRPV